MKPVTFENLKVRVKNSVLVKTKQQTVWSVRLWMEWCLNQIKFAENSTDAPPQLCDMSKEDMSLWLSMFVVEICCQDEKPYPVSSLKHI